MLKEQIEQLKVLNADLATAVVTEKAELKLLVGDLKVNIEALNAVVAELQAKLAEFDGFDLTPELENIAAIATEVKGISESL